MIKLKYNKPDYILKKGEMVLVASRKTPGSYFSARLTTDTDLQSGEYVFVTVDPQIYERDIEVPVNRIKKLFRVVDEEETNKIINSYTSFRQRGMTFPHYAAWQDYQLEARREADVIHEVVNNEPNIPEELRQNINNWYENRVQRLRNQVVNNVDNQA